MQQLHLHRDRETHRLECYTEAGEYVGRIQDKHAAWLAPLLPTVRVYVTAVTGRTQRTQGVNIVLTRIGAALRQHYMSEAAAAMRDTLPANAAPTPST